MNNEEARDFFISCIDESIGNLATNINNKIYDEFRALEKIVDEAISKTFYEIVDKRINDVDGSKNNKAASSVE